MAGNRTPYEMRIFYTVQGLQHVARVGMDMFEDYPTGTLFEDMQIRGRNAVNHNAQLWLLDLASDLQPAYGAADDISHAELWRNDPDSGESFYVSTESIALPGTGAGGIVARQCTFTFRSEGGHYLKFYLMEMNSGTDNIHRPPYPANIFTNIANFLVGSNTPFMARDDTFAVANLGYMFTQNEALYKRRFRPR